MQISTITSQESTFPDILRHIDQPVKSLNILGEMPNLGDKIVAIVGTRKASTYGERVTYQLASELAKAGAVIISGLALGLDGIAHRAAIEADGRTIAVLAHGLDRIYPAAHRNLATHILGTGGALISEYDTGMPPLKHQFIERNRIIAALADITIVVESDTKGGSLITAREAIAAGRTVMAVPGPITSPTSAGTNNLIRTGRGLAITSSTDVITELGFIAREAVPVASQSPEEATILRLIEQGNGTTQGLIEQSGFSAAQFANIISLMEITGKVRNLGAGQWVRR